MPGKDKLLTAAAMSVVIRCEPCIRAYVGWAAKKGATTQELVEFLNVAMTMQGCPREEWALKALRAYDDLIEGRTVAGDGCCTHGKER
ncbi:MAG: carboxymuconolactone decarboxylase family protein [Candidatus Eisenbacteria bacterium]|nr:carboxymuconolactone decarboxylase family protein [Candidatus Eisenbacteria bacterium]